ncbi:unnamed protein product [Leptidea sinapis]|uniref:Protein kinase domain-containing protein n=1 Tax=Leptidea sinapis TaxID=189913 RepID=A0A5E4QJV6_9NEOP|nr:unnamed protein product [Leptidea sinapis]
MGNLYSKDTDSKNLKRSINKNSDGQVFRSQFSLSQFVGNLSGRSFVSVTSNQSVYSAARPWSRVSRRRWHDSTLNSPLEASKTAWPVAHQESIFLPEFQITTDLYKKDFEIIDTLAQGAFGEVFKVKRVSDDKFYALKVLQKAQRERYRTSEGGSKNTISNWSPYFHSRRFSEYIPCGELLALLEKYSTLPEELVKIFVAEIAIAIDFLHNAGVIYRDLKPENILLDSDYHIKLIDFGLSKWLSFGSRTTTLCGTLKYMVWDLSRYFIL